MAGMERDDLLHLVLQFLDKENYKETLHSDDKRNALRILRDELNVFASFNKLYFKETAYLMGLDNISFAIVLLSSSLGSTTNIRRASSFDSSSSNSGGEDFKLRASSTAVCSCGATFRSAVALPVSFGSATNVLIFSSFFEEQSLELRESSAIPLDLISHRRSATSTAPLKKNKARRSAKARLFHQI
nr:Topless-related protein 1 [Ipomoea batatas]